MALAPSFTPLLPFDEACAVIVEYLKKTVPMAFWSISHYDHDQQVYLCVQDDAYGKADGGSHAWSDSFCRYMVTGETPQIAPDAMSVPQYASAGVAQVMTIGAYVGVPIRAADGSLFGTVCGLDPSAQSSQLLEHAPLLRLLADLLGQILRAEKLSDDAAEREAELQWSAFHDHLTGLPNRTMFLDRVGHALELYDRNRRPLAVVALDLDDFTAVNDTLGHAAGDELLVGVADRVRDSLRPGDTLARLGGDEFAILIEDGADPVAIAERVITTVARPFSVDGSVISVSAGVGVAELSSGPAPTGGPGRVTVDTVLARADVAMTSAKRIGRGRFAVYSPVMSLPGTRDLQLREPLRRAVEAGSIEVEYQPIVELGTGEVIAFEALARWSHDGEPVGPDVFIPIAARSGLLPALTEHMLGRAGTQLALWSARLGHRRLQVSVNVPPCRITDPGFPRLVAECIDRHGLGPQQLVLEVTEDALLTDPAAARTVALQLREIGATLSLDDFGTGYSSLLHLQQIPLHAVKIDRGFVADLETNADTERFMGAVLTLGRDLGLRVIVEGVERPAQAEVLRRLGCLFAQGHLFGRPARAADITVGSA